MQTIFHRIDELMEQEHLFMCTFFIIILKDNIMCPSVSVFNMHTSLHCNSETIYK